MSESDARRKAREELEELRRAIEPAKNEDIARRAVQIAERYLEKAENQAKQIQNLEERYRNASPCNVCMYGLPSSSDGKPCMMCPALKKG